MNHDNAARIAAPRSAKDGQEAKRHHPPKKQKPSKPKTPVEPRELPARLRLVADLFCRQLMNVKVIAARRGVPIKRAVELCESLADYPEAIKEVTDGKFAPKTSHDFLEMPAFKAKNESALSEAKYKEDQIRYEFERAAEIKADAEQAIAHARGDE